MENQKKFEQLFEEHYNSNIYELIEDFEYNKPFNPLNLQLIEDKSDDISDSYDYTDELLTKIFYSKELDLYIKFSGRNQSYNGTSWDNHTFVKPTEKIIQTFETI